MKKVYCQYENALIPVSDLESTPDHGRIHTKNLENSPPHTLTGGILKLKTIYRGDNPRWDGVIKLETLAYREPQIRKKWVLIENAPTEPPRREGDKEVNIPSGSNKGILQKDIAEVSEYKDDQA